MNRQARIAKLKRRAVVMGVAGDPDTAEPENEPETVPDYDRVRDAGVPEQLGALRRDSGLQFPWG